MKVYLAGPMGGIPYFNFPAFDRASELLRDQGFEMFNPAERDRNVYGFTIEHNPTGSIKEAENKFGFSLREALAADCAWICENADAVALLPGWKASKGARAERALGVALGLTIMELGDEYA